MGGCTVATYATPEPTEGPEILAFTFIGTIMEAKVLRVAHRTTLVPLELALVNEQAVGVQPIGGDSLAFNWFAVLTQDEGLAITLLENENAHILRQLSGLTLPVLDPSRLLFIVILLLGLAP